MLKRIAIRIVLVTVILMAFNYVYTNLLFEKDIQQQSAAINLVRAVPNNADIIYLGESSNITFRGNDIDKRPISAFIADHFPELNVYDITKPASHSGIFKVLLENIPDSSEVQTVIVTLNLRSFNAQWIYSMLETPLQKSMVLLRTYPPLLNRFLLSFKAYDIKTDLEREQEFKRKWRKDKFHLPYSFPHRDVIQWDYWMSITGIKDKTGKIDAAQTELASHYIKAYGFQIDTLHNPRIKDFNDIVRLSEKKGWNLVFNLLSENTEKARKLAGEDLLYIMNENRNLLIKYYEQKGVTVVDNLNTLEDEQFVDQNWTTEHYSEKGRKKIAKNVADTIKLLHPEAFTSIDYSHKIQTYFFNNCEGNLFWGQNQTITDETSFSGIHSSRTGNGNNFSITFEYPLKLIPDSVNNTINIGLKIKQMSLNHKAKLAFQANGENIKSYWQDFDLKGQVSKINTWSDFNHKFIIPDSIKEADLIKIYVYNTSKEIIYVDDFEIEFK